MAGTRNRLCSHISGAFRQALSSLTNGEFTVAVPESSADDPGFEEPIIWQQCFSISADPALWIVVGQDLWEGLGRITLQAAGIEPVTIEDCRSTWQEINTQTIASLVAEITSDLVREVNATDGEELSAEPADADWVRFSVTGDDGSAWAFKAAWSKDLADLFEPRPERTPKASNRDKTASKTFDVLLEVALPVSVSFGKTSLQIRDILKLNSGSIVELNRMVSDPVEVIVNNCVIARGEVVVVDGNYGVRINELASREERLKTGTPDNSRIGARR